MLMYGSNFCIVMLKPRACNNFPIDAAIMPLPSEEATPPVTKIYLVSATSLRIKLVWMPRNCVSECKFSVICSCFEMKTSFFALAGSLCDGAGNILKEWARRICVVFLLSSIFRTQLLEALRWVCMKKAHKISLWCLVEWKICLPLHRVWEKAHLWKQIYAEIAQLVEHNLAKVGVASSSLVFRSNINEKQRLLPRWRNGRRASFRY